MNLGRVVTDRAGTAMPPKRGRLLLFESGIFGNVSGEVYSTDCGRWSQ